MDVSHRDRTGIGGPVLRHDADVLLDRLLGDVGVVRPDALGVGELLHRGVKCHGLDQSVLCEPMPITCWPKVTFHTPR